MACRRCEACQILKGVRYLRTQVFQPFFQDGVVFRIGSPVLRHLVAYFSGCVRHAVHDFDHIGHIVFKLCSFLGASRDGCHRSRRQRTHGRQSRRPDVADTFGEAAQLPLATGQRRRQALVHLSGDLDTKL